MAFSICLPQSPKPRDFIQNMKKKRNKKGENLEMSMNRTPVIHVFEPADAEKSYRDYILRISTLHANNVHKISIIYYQIYEQKSQHWPTYKCSIRPMSFLCVCVFFSNTDQELMKSHQWFPSLSTSHIHVCNNLKTLLKLSMLNLCNGFVLHWIWNSLLTAVGIFLRRKEFG